MVDVGSLEILKLLSNLSAEIDQGEVLQLQNKNEVYITEQVYLNGVLMDKGTGNDYTIVSQNPLTINFTFAPTSTDKIRITYIKS
jgi:hypothetical protein